MIDALKNQDQDAKNIYRFIRGQFDLCREQPVSDGLAVKILRSIYNDAKNNPASFKPREVELLRDLLPPVLDQLETHSYLVDSGVIDQVLACPHEGKAVGIAMKAFAAGNRSVDPDTVRSVVSAVRAAAPKS